MARQNLSSSLQMSRKAQKFMNIQGTMQQFIKAAHIAETDAARVATQESQTVFASHLSGRPTAPPRVGRPTTGGAFTSYINWVPDPQTNSIKLNINALKGHAPYYLIQEIGTGKTANILNPPGAITIRSQRGRRISSNLFWASGSGQQPSGQAGRLEQLFLSSDLNMKGQPAYGGRRMRIRREIKGKHYIRDGGAAGFRSLSNQLTADAKRIFQ